MLSFFFMPSLLVIAVCLAVHWYCGVRPLNGMDGETMEAGKCLRLRAWEHWKKSDAKAAASRAGTLRFGMASPPLGLLVAAFAVIVGKIPPSAAIAIVLAITAVASVLGLLTAAAELAMLQRFREEPEPGEGARIAAVAEVWNQSLPPALRALFHPGKRMTKSS